MTENSGSKRILNETLLKWQKLLFCRKFQFNVTVMKSSPEKGSESGNFMVLDFDDETLRGKGERKNSE